MTRRADDPAGDAQFYRNVIDKIHEDVIAVLDGHRQALVTPVSPTSGVYVIAAAVVMLLGELLRELAAQDRDRGPQRCCEMIEQLRFYVAEGEATTRVQ